STVKSVAPCFSFRPSSIFTALWAPLADLKAVVPFEVELIPQLVRRLQAENVTEADREHLVYGLSYAGDEGGIVCHLSPSEETGVALVVSPDPCACAPLDAACFGCSRLSKAPSEEAKKAESHLMFENFPFRPTAQYLCRSASQEIKYLSQGAP